MTLLALGNGAPDLSSSIAAVSAGHYELAINALLGARCPSCPTPNRGVCAANSKLTMPCSIMHTDNLACHVSARWL